MGRGGKRNFRGGRGGRNGHGKHRNNNRFNNKRKFEQNESMVSISEQDAGILHYVTPSRPVFGILKQRFLDFQVNEIDSNGKVVHLTSVLGNNDTDEKNDKESKGEEQCVPRDVKAEKENGLSELSKFISQEEAAEVQKLLDPEMKELVEVITKAEEDKAKRSALHQNIRRFLGEWLDSDTFEDGDSKSVRIFRRITSGKKLKGGMRSGKIEEFWPVDRPNHSRFVFYKENKDTNEAIAVLSKMLKCKRRAISFSGTKDKRGATVQLFSGYRISKEKLTNVCKRLRMQGDNLLIGDVEYCDEPLNFGDHTGNQFVVTLRNVSIDGVCPGENSDEEKNAKDEVNSILNAWKEHGFINYFGLQRFGSFSVSTHEVGRVLLQSNFKRAAELLLSQRKDANGEQSVTSQAYSSVEEVTKALEKMPNRMVPERELLKGYVNCGVEAHEKAFSRIPRNLKLMYVHAYQSYIWNLVASKRVEKYGAQRIIVGDLVLVKEGDKEDHIANSGTKVKYVTEEDIAAKIYDVVDVVLPLPGYDIIYPKYSLELYTELLKKDNIDINKMKHKTPEFSLKGDYRTFVEKAKHTKWEWFRYNDPSEQLVASDADKALEKKLPKTNGPFAGLAVTFQLKNSTYATMCIREFLKTSTNSQKQSDFNALKPGQTTAQEENKAKKAKSE